MPVSLTEKRMTMDKKGCVLIIGAGRSGRGMLGELFDRDGWQLIFADNDTQLVEGLRKQNYYTVQMTDLSTNENQERRIEDFKVLDTVNDYEEYIDAIINAHQLTHNLKVIKTICQHGWAKRLILSHDAVICFNSARFAEYDHKSYVN